MYINNFELFRIWDGCNMIFVILKRFVRPDVDSRVACGHCQLKDDLGPWDFSPESKVRGLEPNLEVLSHVEPENFLSEKGCNSPSKAPPLN